MANLKRKGKSAVAVALAAAGLPLADSTEASAFAVNTGANIITIKATTLVAGPKFSALTTTGISEFSSTQISQLSTRQLTSLSRAQIAALAPSQLGFSSAQLLALA